MTTKKIEFQLQLNWLEKTRGILTSNEVGDTIRVALPASFGGTGNEWSPEHLFLASISSCFMTTFLVLADKKRLPILNFECHAEGQVQFLNGRFQFTDILVYPKIIIQDALLIEKAHDLMKKTEKYCLISNSISSSITYKSEVIMGGRHPVVNN